MTRFSDRITLYIVLFLPTFIGIAAVFVQHEALTDLNQLQIHSTIIADDVWAVNPAGADPYLQLAMTVNSYKNIVVTQLGGEIRAETRDGLTRFFVSLPLECEIATN